MIAINFGFVYNSKYNSFENELLTFIKVTVKNYFQMISKVDGRIVKIRDGVTSNTVSNNICKSSNSITFTITYKLVCSLFSEQCLHQFCLTLLLERG